MYMQMKNNFLFGAAVGGIIVYLLLRKKKQQCPKCGAQTPQVVIQSPPSPPPAPTPAPPPPPPPAPVPLPPAPPVVPETKSFVGFTGWGGVK